MLNQMIAPYSISIQLLETQRGQISSNLNPRQQGGLPSDTMKDQKISLSGYVSFEDIN